ncbi:uncharacterized protein ACR2FA_003968 [Aphomia sociella]
MSSYMLVLCIQITSMYAAPFPSLQSLQLEPSQISLQQQLLALQQLQMMRQMNMVNSPVGINSAPLILLLPNTIRNTIPDTNNEYKISHLNNDFGENNQLKNSNNNEDSELDSVVIDAESDMENNSIEKSQKAILLLPNRGRLSIGDVISSIPFLPIEINVPDTASWIYNWIASIISGIGQRWPLRPKPQDNPAQGANLRLLLNQLQYKKQSQVMPVIIVPLETSMIPGL